MKLAIRKVIAREFLVLMLVTAIGLFSFFIQFLLNTFRQYQVESLKKEVAEKVILRDGISKQYLTKTQNQEWYFKKFSDAVDLGELNTAKKWWSESIELVTNDTILLVWEWSMEIFSSMGFSTPDSLKRFIINNTLNKSEIENEKNYESFQNKISSITSKQARINRNILSIDKQISFSMVVLLIIAFFLFGIRYLYYAIKLSLNTLKEKANE